MISSVTVSLALLAALVPCAKGDVHTTKDNIRFDKRDGDRPGGKGRGVPNWVQDNFKRTHGIKAGYDLTLLEVGNDNQIVMPDGEIINLDDDDFHQAPIFSPKAKCYDSDVEIPCPVVSSVSTKYTNNGVRIQVNRNGNGEIESISTRRKHGGGGGGGGHHTVQAIDTNVFVEIPDEALDPEYFNQFVMQSRDEDIDSRFRRKLRGSFDAAVEAKRKREGGDDAAYDDGDAATAHDDDGHEHRNLQVDCSVSGYREIEVAVAVESSFCADVGEANVESKVQSIMADVSAEYEMDGLCFVATVVHFEKYCNIATDPYKPGVDLNASGCSEYGLLDFFQDYWNANRGSVQRDLAELFSGTGLECFDSGGCV